jgi:hypothetical protein
MEIFSNINIGWFIIFYVIACHGLVQILIYSPLFDKPREYILNNISKHLGYNLNFLLLKLMECSMCLGFWVGFVTTVFLFHFLTSIACGFFISATCYFLDILQKMIEKKGE